MIRTRTIQLPSRIPSRAVALLVVGLALALVQASAWGQDVLGATRLEAIPDGAEAVVTDRLGRRLVGYGRVAEHALRLSVVDRDDVDDLLLVLITPNGTFSRLEGRLTERGITVRDGLTERSLDDWLSLRGVTLVLERVDDPRPRPDADDDRRDDEPSRDDDADDDDADDDGADDDDADDDTGDDRRDDEPSRDDDADDDADGDGDGDDDDDDDDDDDAEDDADDDDDGDADDDDNDDDADD